MERALFTIQIFLTHNQNEVIFHFSLTHKKSISFPLTILPTFTCLLETRIILILVNPSEMFYTSFGIEDIISWEPEGHWCCSTMFCWEPEGCYHHGHLYISSALLVFKRKSFNSDNALPALNWQYYLAISQNHQSVFNARGGNFIIKCQMEISLSTYLIHNRCIMENYFMRILPRKQVPGDWISPLYLFAIALNIHLMG